MLRGGEGMTVASGWGALQYAAMGEFADHFSQHAALYAARRPRYPDGLFAWLAAQAPARTRAWDAGCGSGQATLGLVEHFDDVIASDPSAEQVAQAAPHPRIHYRVEPAEAPSLDTASVDLVLVAQALHWFDLEQFYPQVRRVLRPGGVIAACSYGLCHVDDAVDRVFGYLYDQLLGDYWPHERRHVENGYRELAFPFPEIAAPEIAMTQHWALAEYLGYLRSWSASQRYLQATGQDPVEGLADRFAEAWGAPAGPRQVSFPLALRVGRRD